MVVLLLILLALTSILAIGLGVALARARRAARALQAARPASLERPPATDDAFERLPIAAVRVDDGTRLLAASARARERFPFLQAGRLLLECFGEHRLSEQVTTAIETGVPSEAELRLFTDDRRTYRVVAEPVDTGGGRECLVFMTDLTEAIAYQELRSQFVANVSHELRTPITGLRGLLEALADDGMDPEVRTRFAGRAVAETQRLEALITDILFLSELEAAPAGADAERADLCEAVRASVEALSGIATEAGATVEVLAAGRLMVPLTEAMARTVVQNLLENAIKYGGANTHVVVEARIDAAGESAVLIVADNGPGIAERHVPHIFERFYRADASRSKRLGGTGLGLSIVKHISEWAGGRATAASREGFGTTITITIPMATGISGPGAPTGTRPASADLPTG